MSVRVDFNEEFFRDIGTAPELVTIERGIAQRVLEEAVASAPKRSGDYARSLSIEVERHTYRDTVQVVSSDPFAMLVEAKHGTLARALLKGKQ